MALMRGVAETGFEAYLAPEDQSSVIAAFRYPKHPAFQFEAFYGRLSELGIVIYPGKLTTEPCFRVGTVGRLSPPDIDALLAALRQVLEEMEAVCGVRAAS
jgi:2-aminoethylphosphonate-pyruvate transaminase